MLRTLFAHFSLVVIAASVSQMQTADCAEKCLMRWFLLPLMVAVALPLDSSAELTPVKVLRVTNGQEVLIEIDGQGRALRLACLQAPRPSQQPWDKRASSAMHSLVKRGASGRFDLRGRDVYGRLVGRLLINGRDVGASLVQLGAVFAWDGSLGQCDQLNYVEFEAFAQRKRLGVWSVNGGLRRPWDEMEALEGGEP